MVSLGFPPLARRCGGGTGGRALAFAFRSGRGWGCPARAERNATKRNAKTKRNGCPHPGARPRNAGRGKNEENPPESVTAPVGVLPAVGNHCELSPAKI